MSMQKPKPVGAVCKRQYTGAGETFNSLPCVVFTSDGRRNWEIDAHGLVN